HLRKSWRTLKRFCGSLLYCPCFAKAIGRQREMFKWDGIVPGVSNHRKSRWLLCSVLAMAAAGSSVRGQTQFVKPIDPCLGPNPSCSSGCPSSSGDGLNDAWKRAGGIDLNGDGRVDAVHDLILPDVKLGRKDIFVQYDYLYLPDEGTSCTPT